MFGNIIIYRNIFQVKPNDYENMMISCLKTYSELIHLQYRSYIYI